MDADHQSIVDQTIRYCWALDTKDFDDLANVFTPAGVADYAGQVNEGVEAVQAACQAALHELDSSQHIVANHQVEVRGDEASSRCYFQAQHTRAGARDGPNYTVAGTYTDEWVRTTDGWRIRHRVLRVLWTEGSRTVTRP